MLGAGNLAFYRLVKVMQLGDRGGIYYDLVEIESIFQFVRSSRLNLVDQSANRGLAWVYWKLNQQKRAFDFWNQSGLTGKDFIMYGERMQRNGDLEEALFFYEHAKDLHPDSGVVWHALGTVYSDQEEWKSALKCFRRASKLSPENRDFWYWLGKAYLEVGNVKLALDSFECALSATNGSLGLSNVYFQIGNAYHHYAEPLDWERAWSAYEMALSIDDYRFQIGNV